MRTSEEILSARKSDQAGKIGLRDKAYNTVIYKQ